MKTLTVVSFLMAGMAFGACKKSNQPSSHAAKATASFVIDGGPFHQQKFTIAGNINNDHNADTYFAGSKKSAIYIGDSPDAVVPDKVQVSLFFNGSSAGTQKLGDDADEIIFEVDVTDKDGIAHEYVYDILNKPDASITITKYGGVGDTVEGSFTGSLVDYNNQDVVKITNGSFSVKRDKDNPL